MLQLFTLPRKGLFSLLNEECVFPKGSDETFTLKLLKEHRDNPRLGKPAPGNLSVAPDAGFCIAHYAGSVTYTARDFLLKNKDPLSEDLQARRTPHLLAVCIPCACHARAVCVPCACRGRAVCVPCAYRVRAVCVPCMCRVRAVCVPCV